MKRIGTSIIISILSLTSFAQQIGDTTRLHPDPQLGVPPNPEAIDIVILGDGYTIGDSTDFRNHAADVWDELINHTSPFTEYQDYFNIYRIDIESAEQGIDEPCLSLTDTIGTSCDTVFYDTYYDCSFDGTSFAGNVIDRLAMANFDTVRSVLHANGFDTTNTFVFLLANCEGFYTPTTIDHSFGGGYWNDRVAICPAASELPNGNPSPEDQAVAIHEFIHAFSQTLDEYWTDHAIDYASNTWNMCDTNLLSQVPWRNWVDTTVWYWGIEDDWTGAWSNLPLGIYPHRPISFTAPYIDGNWGYDTISTGWFKPTSHYNCNMEDVDKDLCSVCREATIERIHGLAPAMYGHSPENADPIDASEELTFSIELIQTTNNTVVVEWWLNGDSITTNNGTWQLDCDAPGWNIGTNTLTAMVEDRTPFIRIDDHSGHTQSVSWTIEFNGAEADLWMADNTSDDGSVDLGGGIAWGTGLDHSPDIYLRNQADGLTVQEHEDPDYGSGNVHAYLKVKNRGCKTTDATRDVCLYWSLAAGGWAWPEYFDGIAFPDSGGFIGCFQLPTGIATGDSSIAELPWVLGSIPSTLIADNGNEACLLARLDSTTDDPNLWFDPLAEYIWYNNNMALHNVDVVNVEQEGQIVVNGHKYPPGGFFHVGNITELEQKYDLTFNVDNDHTGKELSKQAEIHIAFDNSGWDISSALSLAQLEGLKQATDHSFVVTSDHAAIRNITFPPKTRLAVYTGFGFLTKEVESHTEYWYHVSQQHVDGGFVTGNQHYQIIRDPRALFDADAGNDKEVDRDAQVTVEAEDILEDATYNWYDMDGNLIYTGKDLTVTADITKKYKLEVIAELDGYKDYSEVEVKVKMGTITSITPNPATNQTVISYDTQGGLSAYIAVYNTITGSSDQFIVPLGSGSLNLDLSGYQTGGFQVMLVTDGQVRDSEGLLVE